MVIKDLEEQNKKLNFKYLLESDKFDILDDIRYYKRKLERSRYSDFVAERKYNNLLIMLSKLCRQ